MNEEFYDLTQSGPQVQAILNKAAQLPENPSVVIEGKIEAAVSITYAALKALRDGGTLKPGQLYRITDYVTTVNGTPDPRTGMVMVRSAGHQFDLLVRADAADTLNETAWAVQHDGDTYFQNARLEAWQLKYTLDNDSNRYEWADTEQGKGVIYEMQDEWGNRLPYDFKNVQFLRIPIMGQSHLYVNSGYPTEMDDDGYVTDVIGAKLTINTLNPTDNQRMQKLGAYLHPFMGYYSEQYIYDDGYSDSWDGLTLEDGGTRLFAQVTDNYENYGILAEVDKTKAVWCHTLGKLTAFTTGETEDVTLTGRAIDFQMSPYIVSDGKEGLPYNVMVSSQNKTYKNTRITGYFYGNTISGYIQYSSISGYIGNTSISGDIYYTSVSGSIEYTTIKGYCYYLSLPALKHCIVAGNLPEGGGWDSLLEVPFTGQDYEQVITRNADDEIVVRPLYAI